MNELEMIRDELLAVRSQVREYRQWNEKYAEGWKSKNFKGQKKVEVEKEIAHHEGWAEGLEQANFMYLDVIEMVNAMLDAKKEEKK